MHISMKVVTLSIIVGFSGWPLLSMAEPGEKPCCHNLGESDDHQHDGEYHGKEPCDSKKGEAYSGSGDEPCDSKKGKAYSGDEPCDSKKDKEYLNEKPCDKKKSSSLSPADETATLSDDKPLDY